MSQNPTTLTKIHVGHRASALKEPYSAAEVARIDDFMLSVFLCQGSIAWHRHIDEDEMFLVYTGAITLDSEIGSVFLRPGELTVVPKGARHRSMSPLRSEVILFQPWLLADRHNGDRRVYALPETQTLSKINVYATALHLSEPYVPLRLASVGDFSVSVILCQGTSPERIVPYGKRLLLTQQGEVRLNAGPEGLDLYPGDTVLLPKGLSFSLSSERRSLLLEFSRQA